MDEIERKFLVKDLPPEIDRSAAMPYERFFLYMGEHEELRIQLKGTEYCIERKSTVSQLHATKQKMIISAEEYEALKMNAVAGVTRDGYLIPSIPGGTIKVYKGAHEGLARAEVEFKTEAEARAFVPPAWFGPEITTTDLARDSKLARMNKGHMQALIRELQHV